MGTKHVRAMNRGEGENSSKEDGPKQLTLPVRWRPMAVTTGATLDKFVLWISATDPNWDPKRAEAFVRSLGAEGVRLVGAPIDVARGALSEVERAEGGADA